MAIDQAPTGVRIFSDGQSKDSKQGRLSSAIAIATLFTYTVGRPPNPHKHTRDPLRRSLLTHAHMRTSHAVLLAYASLHLPPPLCMRAAARNLTPPVAWWLVVGVGFGLGFGGW